MKTEEVHSCLDKEMNTQIIVLLSKDMYMFTKKNEDIVLNSCSYLLLIIMRPMYLSDPHYIVDMLGNSEDI